MVRKRRHNTRLSDALRSLAALRRLHEAVGSEAKADADSAEPEEGEKRRMAVLDTAAVTVVAGS